VVFRVIKGLMLRMVKWLKKWLVPKFAILLVGYIIVIGVLVFPYKSTTEDQKRECVPPQYDGLTSKQAQEVALRQPRSNLRKARATLQKARARLRAARSTAQRRQAQKVLQAALRRYRVAQESFTAAQRGPRPIAASLQPGALTSFDFGRSLSPGPRSVPLSLAAPLQVGTPLDVKADLFARESDGRQMPRGLEVWAGVSQEKIARVWFCVSSDIRHQMHPGTYQGALVLDDPRVQRIPVPVSFSVSFPSLRHMIALAFVLCGLASVFTWTLRRPEVLSYPKWATSLIGFLTIISGFIAASIAFSAQYLEAGAWGESHTEVLAFIGAVTTAFVTGATAGKLATNDYARKDRGERTTNGHVTQGTGTDPGDTKSRASQ